MTRYARGAEFERSVVKLLEERGWVCIRAAGSHGAADVVAARRIPQAKGSVLLFIQCKVTGKLAASERAKLLEAADQAGAIAVLAFRQKRGVIAWRRVSQRHGRPRQAS